MAAPGNDHALLRQNSDESYVSDSDNAVSEAGSFRTLGGGAANPKLDKFDDFGARCVDCNYEDEDDDEAGDAAIGKDAFFVNSPRAEMQRQMTLGEEKMSGSKDNFLGTDPMFRAPSKRDVIMENNVQSFISGMATDYNAMSITFKRNNSLPKGTPPVGAAPNPFASGAPNPFASDTSMFDQTWSGSAQKFRDSGTDDDMFED